MEDVEVCEANENVCPLIGINVCKWYAAGESQWVQGCDPKGCAPGFQWCYFEDKCMRMERLEAESDERSDIRLSLGCNNGSRYSGGVGYDDTMWYSPQETLQFSGQENDFFGSLDVTTRLEMELAITQ